MSSNSSFADRAEDIKSTGDISIQNASKKVFVRQVGKKSRTGGNIESATQRPKLHRQIAIVHKAKPKFDPLNLRFGSKIDNS